MNQSIRILIIISVVLSWPGAPASAQVRDPGERGEIIEKAEALAGQEGRSVEELLEGVRQHPFHRMPESVPSAADGPGPGDASGATLERIAEGISPDGRMVIRGTVYLVLEGRRIEAGDYISVAYGGNTYQVQIVDIETNSFTLRLNEEEIEKNLN